MTQVYQCRLSDPAGTKTVVAWIEERGAKAGALVEMKDLDGAMFRVDEVYKPGMDARTLRDKQQTDRNCFGSLMA